MDPKPPHQPDPSAPSPVAPVRRRWRRRLLWGLVGLLVLLLLAGAAVQAVLWTDLPRQWVLDALQRSTGLRIEARSLRVGWLGGTTLRDAQVSLPLEADPFLALPTLKLQHTNLLTLALTRSLEIESISLLKPELWVRRDEDGAWNLVRVMQQVQAALPQKNDAAGGTVRLPDLTISEATVHLELPDQTFLRVTPVALEGRHADPLVWSFKASAGDLLAAEGGVLPGSTWAHSLRVEGRDLDQVVEVFVAGAPQPLTVEGHWEGQVTAGQLQGRADLNRLQAGELTLRGPAAVAADQGGLVLRPQGMEVTWADRLPAPLRLENGSLRLVESTLGLRRLGLAMADLRASVDGEFNLEAQRGEAALRWAGALPGVGFPSEGQAEATYRGPDVGRLNLEANLTTRTLTPAGAVEGRAQLQASGPTFRELDLTLSLPRLIWQKEGKDPYLELAGVVGELSLRDQSLGLTRLTLPEAEAVRASASLALDTQAWQASLNTQRWRMPRGPAQPVDLALQAHGRRQAVKHAELTLTEGDTHLSLKASYMPGDANPALDASVQLRHTYRHYPDASPSAPEAGPAEPPAADLTATLNLETSVVGELRPLDLGLAGTVAVQDITWDEQPVDSLSFGFTSRVEEQAWTIRTEPFTFLDGQWTIGSAVDPGKADVVLDLRTQGLRLARVTELLGWPFDADGLFTGELQAMVPVKNIEGLRLEGNWKLAELSGRAADLSEGAEGRFALREGMARFEDVTLRRGDGRMTGGMEFNVRERQRLEVRFNAEDWPFTVGPPAPEAISAGAEPADALRLILNGGGRFDLDVMAEPMTAQGRLDLDVQIAAAGHDLGRVALAAGIDGRTVTLDRFQGRLLGGQTSGHATVPLDRPVQSRGEIEVTNLDLGVLATHLPWLERTGGTVTATLSAREAEGERLLGPVRVLLELQAHDARVFDLTVGDGRLVGYVTEEGGFILHEERAPSDAARVSVDPPGAGNPRPVPESDRGSFLQLAGGTLRPWFKLDQHGPQTYTHTRLSLERLNMAELSQALDPVRTPVRGRLSGSLNLVGYLPAPNRLTGGGSLQLINSDLGETDIFGALRRALNLGSQEADGQGTVEVDLEGSRLLIRRLHYFNRPLDATATFIIDDIYAGRDSPIWGQALGTIRPLKESDIEILEKLDTALGAIQTGTAAVEVRGTLGDRAVRLVPVPAIGQTLKRILTGEVE